MASLLAGAGLGWVTRPDGAVVGDTGPEGPRPPAEVGTGLARTQSSEPDPTAGALAAQTRFCQRLKGAGVDRMAEFLDEAAREPDAIRQRALQEIIIDHMVSIDPMAAWEVLDKSDLKSWRPQFLGAWARTDAEAAVAWVDAQGGEAKSLMASLIDGLLPDDVITLAAIWPRVAADAVDDAPVAGLFRGLASTDPARARALLGGMPAGASRNMGASAFAEGWARGDVEAAYAWAKALGDPAERESALRGVFRAWAEKDPQAVAGRLDELTTQEYRDTNGQPLARGEHPARAIVRAWAEQDPLAAAAWLRQRPGDGIELFRELFASEILPLRDTWSVAEVSAMMRQPGEKEVTDRVGDLFQSRSTGNFGERSFSIWGPYGGYGSPLGNGHLIGGPPPVRFDDPATAFSELTQQPPDATRQHLLQEVARQWAERDPDAARARLRETDDPLLKLGLMNALYSMAQNSLDLDLAAEVAAAHPDGAESGRHRFGSIYEDLIAREPERARALLENEMDDSQRGWLVQQLAKDQASYDPMGAVAWALQQPTAELRQGATAKVMRAWAATDAYAASEWLAAQPAGPERDPAVNALVGTLAESSPDEALAWAGALSDPAWREQETAIVLSRLIQRDPERARPLLESAALSDQQRQKLILQLEERLRP